MLFPKTRMRLTDTFRGKTEPEGWIVLDLKGLDLEGASKVYLSLADIEKIKAGGDVQSKKLAQARALLGGFGDETEETDEDNM
jgi:hypothetical protein